MADSANTPVELATALCAARAGNEAICIETAGYRNCPVVLGGVAILMCVPQARAVFK